MSLVKSIRLTITFGSKIFELTFKENQCFGDVKRRLEPITKLSVSDMAFVGKSFDDTLPISVYELGSFHKLELISKKSQSFKKSGFGRTNTELAMEIQQQLWQEDQLSKKKSSLTQIGSKKISSSKIRIKKETEKVKYADEVMTLRELIEVAPPSLGEKGFLEQFEEEFGTDHAEFSPLSFKSWFKRNRSSPKLKLVYFHEADAGEPCERFVKEILCDRTVKICIQEHFTFWAGTIDEIEYEEDLEDLEDLLDIKEGFPYLGVFSNGFNSTLIYRYAKNVPTPKNVFNKLLDLRTEYNPGTSLVPKQRLSRRTSSVLIKQKQDLEYEKSLLKDTERERILQLVRQQIDEEKLKETLQLEESERIKKLRIKQFEKEPSGENTVQVLFRSSQGEKILRKFLNSDQVIDLFKFVQYKFPDISEFKLVCRSPMIEYLRKDSKLMKKTLKEQGINQTMLLIRELDN
ncbi:fas-associated protein [Anaeramoeba flamelloides]|uniref:Fas-associated protein n=1 Tax=Anaeramoeba flamelloides TaxID=1746091 RepID=A0AAV7ZFT0_9EUKA|nr:fas-associated protein [Anaeramoeba flamelloides]